jgi:acyl-CoA hydrolase
MDQPSPVHFIDLEACVEATLNRVGKRIVLGLPVAIGKPNPLVNAFVKRVVSDPSLHLTIMTALSLRKPRWHNDLERRLVQPLAQRVFGDYPELEYIRMIEQQRLPDNIEVIEFFLEPGAWLGNAHLQQHYLSANYTHVARDAMRRGLNVIAQIVASPPPGEAAPGLLSLGSNPDLTVDLLPAITAMRDSGRPFALIGQMNQDLPFMYGDALIAADTFDFLVDTAPFPLFCPPNMPISLTEHAIALNVSALIRDGGTLQVGIGELGDSIVYAMQLRHQRPEVYQEVLKSTGVLERHRRLIESEGGTAPFECGLYGCTEMLVDGFLDLYRSGILKRRVYPNARLQRLLDDGHIDDRVSLRTLEALCAAGMRRMSFAEFNELRDAGVFRDEVQYDGGMLISSDDAYIPVNFQDPASRAEIAKTCLGERLRNGILVDAGFFFGPKGFYAGLRQLDAAERRLFAMRGISFVNELYGPAWELKIAQRRHARFINTTMMLTGLGAAVSDALADGRVVSGVGGQYNFVAMAHALPEARSILCLRATHTAKGVTTSNIVWSYGNTTIPRHLRDIVVTEYGIADLRGKTDREVAEALVTIMDARFQDRFIAGAKHSGKLPAGYRPTATARSNVPHRIVDEFAAWRKQGLFVEVPFGSDLTSHEVVLTKALKRLATKMESWLGRTRLAIDAVRRADTSEVEPYLVRMSLQQPKSFNERVQRRLLAVALRDVLSDRD